MSIIGDMKIRLCNLLLLSLLLVVCLAGRGVCSDPADVYQLDVRLSPESQQLDGEARLNLSADRLAAGLSLRLSSHAELLEVTLNGQPADFSFSGENLIVEPTTGKMQKNLH